MTEKPNRTWRISLVIVGIGIGLVALLLASHRSSSREALDAYISQLRARGEKLSAADLGYGPPQAMDPRLASLWRATADLHAATFSPGSIDLRKFVSPGRAEVLLFQDSPAPHSPPFVYRSKSPVSASNTAKAFTWSSFQEDIESNEAALADIRKALENPPPWSGVVPAQWGSGKNFNFVAFRQAAQWLSGAAISAMHEGNTNECLLDLEALIALTRVYRNDHFLVSQMIRIAVANLALVTTWEILQAARLTEPQLNRLQTLWEEVDLLESLETGFVGERANSMEFWSTIHKSSSTKVRSLLNMGSSKTVSPMTVIEDYIGLPAYRMTAINDDQLFYLKAMQEDVDITRSLRAHEPWLPLKKRLDARAAEFSRIAGSPQKWKYLMTLIALPNFTRAISTGVHAETERQITLTAVALRRYELAYGHPPPDLATLVSTFLKSMPVDPINGKALSYHTNADGTFMLYSVGDDGRDDGGDLNSTGTGKMDFWSGRDAGWPRPAVNGP